MRGERVIPKLAVPQIERQTLADGAFVLRSQTAATQGEGVVGQWLVDWARRTPKAVFLAQRGPGGDWTTLTFGQALERARAIGASLLARGLDLERPLLLLSGNSIEHALMALGGILVGVPVVPLSEAYSLRSRDHRHLRRVAELVTPGMIFATDGEAFAPALSAVASRHAELVVGRSAPFELTTTPLASLLETTPGAEFDAATASVGPQSVAKILMTSGSTGEPKGVLNTHAMLTSNQEAMAIAWPFLEEDLPVIVDWLPWSHTFGGNHNFNMILRNGGTLYIDGGRPLPGRFDETLKNLRDVSPTFQFNVPAGYAMLAHALERDAGLRETFFSRLQGMFFAGAALPQGTWDRLDAIALEHLGHRTWLTTSWGATETAPAVTSAHFSTESPANIGVPLPGVELKFVPSGSKMELRVRGPNVTPGYHRQPQLTEAAFDDEGFYRIGDAGALVDTDEPSAGVMFDGRVSEDFKLASGTWVNVGRLRNDVLTACGGLLQNAVVVGHGRDEVGVLGWLAAAAASEVADGEADPAKLAADVRVHDRLRDALERHNVGAQGGSRRIARMSLLVDPPSLDASEITDKGYVNASAVMAHREAEIDELFSDSPNPRSMKFG